MASRIPTLTKLKTGNDTFDRWQDHVLAVLNPALRSLTIASDAAGSGGAPSGAAGGDLAGTYPSPSVKSVAHVTTGTLGVAHGGTGSTSLTANGVLVGNGTSAPTTVAPGTSGNVLTSDGTAWTSAAPAAVASRRIALDADDYLVWTLDESAVPLLNTGTAGTAGDLDTQNTHPMTLGRVGFFGGSAWNPGNGTIGVGVTASGSTSLEPAYPITYSAWVYPVSFSTQGNPICKAYRAPGTWTSPFVAVALDITTSGTVEFVITISGSRVVLTSSGLLSAVSLGRWNHIAGTYDGTTMLVYVNGQLVGTKAQTGAIDYGTHGRYSLSIPPENASAETYGYDDIRISTVARSAAYIEAMWRAGMNLT